jgi:prepilin-type N-terminal cleavage/methylation domain-containing protein/prepilin-type processing-associated H-X9-DG protein
LILSRKFCKNDAALPMLAMETEMKAQRTMHNGTGFTLTELLVVICVIGLLAVLLLPALAAAKRKHATIGCINNLKQIGLAFRIWEGDNGDKFPMQYAATNDALMKLVSDGNAYVLWQTMSNELNPKLLVCPADQQRTAAASFTQNFSDANISYFLILDASDAYPQMMLCGDDNIAVNGVRVRPGILNLPTNTVVGWTKERHGGTGNIALSDGSVQSARDFGLANRLVIP